VRSIVAYVECVVCCHAAGTSCRAKGSSGDLVPGSKVGFEVEFRVRDRVKAGSAGLLDGLMRRWRDRDIPVVLCGGHVGCTRCGSVVCLTRDQEACSHRTQSNKGS
jgi:hypothetical protein